MALADRTPPNSIHGYPCSVGALLNTLDDAELKAFKEMLGTPQQRGWSASAIWEACTAEGYTVGLQTINRHRGGKCRCFRQAAA